MDAAWAFVVVAQIPTRQGPSFWKIGFAADALDDAVGPFQPTAIDAEATALIAAVEFLLPVVNLDQTVHCHFDASAVGFGAFGVQAIPKYHGQVSTRQHNARVMMSFLQQQTRAYPVHVHAHEGNPFNELVDSIASHVRKLLSNRISVVGLSLHTHVGIGRGFSSSPLKWYHRCLIC